MVWEGEAFVNLMVKMNLFPKVAVIILNWNGKKWLEAFLPSVATTTYPNVEIWIVDNGSTDDSVGFVKSMYPQFKILELGYNYGFTEGNNRALPYIDAPFYVLLNSDVEVSAEWLEPMVECIIADEKIAVVQPKLMAYHSKNEFEHAGGAGGMMDVFGYPLCRGRVFETTEQDMGQYEEVSEIFWATGACCLVRKSVSDEIGLFEAHYFAHMEEIDFCWRAKNMGYKIFYTPHSKVWHVGGGTLHKSNPRKTYLNFRNSLSTLVRNLPAGWIIPMVFVRLCLDGVFGIVLLLKWDWDDIWAIIRAHWAFYGEIPRWLRMRRRLYKGHKLTLPSTGRLRQSIVWGYFVKGKKFFRDYV